MTHQTPAQHRAMLACRDYVLDALSLEMEHRHDRSYVVWIPAERNAVADAANLWAEINGYPQRITELDVECIEATAVGHVDYATKLALRVAEVIVGVVPLDIYSRPKVR